jgi:DNA-binding PadR family transcriptional regulator
VSLTPKGWELLERKLASWRSLWEEKLAGVSDRDLETTARVIQQVTELYEAISEGVDSAAAEHGPATPPRETRR